ncbi:hypothetical protein QBC46DRAFT_376374 [Diplogelasinospora grovesii]|uniref:Uncharacterized protein n=1 Tax=Diplogelasinospora grovesii TaxID=303347 RepID=A0AAN6S8E6_9PEZI|nr:hypothetical protein QBC46DRAFT_376374 [Diplogelasinospora grovesii]
MASNTDDNPHLIPGYTQAIHQLLRENASSIRADDLRLKGPPAHSRPWPALVQQKGFSPAHCHPVFFTDRLQKPVLALPGPTTWNNNNHHRHPVAHGYVYHNDTDHGRQPGQVDGDKPRL